MIKGVNRQVVEITQTQCEYFERVLFFIKPEYSAVSEGDLRERASEIRLPAKCKACELRDQCKACAAMVITESGDFHTVPEYRCRMSKSYLSACNCLKEELLKQVEG